MNRPIHFELHSIDPERDSKFYKSVFGWNFHKWDGPMEHWLVSISPDGKTLINTSETTNMAHFIDTATRQIVANVLVDARPRYARFEMPEGGSTFSIDVPRMAIPGVGRLVYFTDPTGNIMGIMQHDPNAK